MRKLYIISCSFLTFSIVSILLGISLSIAGVVRHDYYYSDYLFSLPIYPDISDDYFTYWSFKNSNQLNKLETKKSANSFSFLVKQDDFSKSYWVKSTVIHIVHNLWGYEINGSIQSDDNQEIMNFQFSRNPNIGDFTQPSKIISSQSLPNALRKYGDFRIKCPFSTLITKGYESICTREIGAPSKLSDKYEVIDVGRFEVSRVSPNVTITFTNLRGLPYDFVITPQIYLGFWRKTNASLLQAIGFIIASSGLTILFITIIVFFGFFSGNSDAAA